ncbi:hypothetical protein BOTBODRAFT_38808 [Botryobasidium botryosum FD-172 SS1]|uniref:MYND-type domain-containing protein n=1 Tax=Botryobasidium botryosum (strain FD-172 SS1) TaxID=930990 RepID=A0A067M7F1_BOTB1|nr:hypothetical protein BOTBODRAFT_38808 [Botryobasidium botryosum FD-172 SS1]
MSQQVQIKPVFFRHSDDELTPKFVTEYSESEIVEIRRKEHIQCHYCSKSRASGVVLKKCGGCLIGMYCDSDCQKKAWPAHKSACKQNQHAAKTTGAFEVQSLVSYTRKNRPIFSDYGEVALNLMSDPTRCLRYVLLIFLERPEFKAGSEPHPKQSQFRARDACAVSLDETIFGKLATSMREQLALTNGERRGAGDIGSYFVILWHAHPDLESDPPESRGRANLHTVPIGFSETSLKVARVNAWVPWRDILVQRLNARL